MKDFFVDREIKNDIYSELNITLSKEVLFDIREPYLYPEALLIGFKLAKNIYKDQSKEISLIEHLKNNLANEIDIDIMLGEVFGLTSRNLLLIESGKEIIDFLRDIRSKSGVR